MVDVAVRLVNDAQRMVRHKEAQKATKMNQIQF
jgi:hypothetical protein